MNRHKNWYGDLDRYEDFYDPDEEEDGDSLGRSAEDPGFAISPSTANQYLIRRPDDDDDEADRGRVGGGGGGPRRSRERTTTSSTSSASNHQSESENQKVADQQQRLIDEIHQLDDAERLALAKCVETVHDVIGDHFPDGDVRSECLRAHFDSDRAIDGLLNRKEAEPSKVDPSAAAAAASVGSQAATFKSISPRPPSEAASGVAKVKMDDHEWNFLPSKPSNRLHGSSASRGGGAKAAKRSSGRVHPLSAVKVSDLGQPAAPAAPQSTQSDQFLVPFMSNLNVHEFDSQMIDASDWNIDPDQRYSDGFFRTDLNRMAQLVSEELARFERCRPLLEREKFRKLYSAAAIKSQMAPPSPLGVLVTSRWRPALLKRKRRQRHWSIGRSLKRSALMMIRSGYDGDDNDQDVIRPFDFSTPSPDEKQENKMAAAAKGSTRLTTTIGLPTIRHAVSAQQLQSSDFDHDDKDVRFRTVKLDDGGGGGGGRRPAMGPRPSLDGRTSKARQGQLRPGNATPASRSSSPRASPAGTPTRMAASAASTAKFDPDALRREYAEDTDGQKESINLVVIGHVDAGKSTLMGHLLVRTGNVSKKAMHRYETDSRKFGKASFLYAWVLDETAEERSRGITIDVAESHFETAHRRVTLLDAPGHRDFIPNMIMGAGQADAAILVIDATKGEFETGFEDGGQTREHTLLVRSLGVQQLIVAINKLDTVAWSPGRFREIVDKISVFLRQVGFKEADVSYVPCSGLLGENLTSPSHIPELAAWYPPGAAAASPTLLDLIDALRPPERPVTRPLRLSIGDIFKGNISGLALAGRIQSGGVHVGQKVVIQPAAEVCTIKSIALGGGGGGGADQSSSSDRKRAFAGSNVVLTVQGADPANISIGDVLCEGSLPIPVAAAFEARIVLFNNVEIPITKGYPIEVHIQSVTQGGNVAKLISSLSRSTGEVLKRRPRFLAANSDALVAISVKKPVCLETFKDNKDLGRFMIRGGGATIAAGVVTKILS